MNLQGENDKQTKEVDRLKKECEEKDETLKKLRKDVTSSNELNETLQKLNQQKDSLENAVKQLHDEMEALQISKRSLEAQLKEAAGVIERLKGDVATKDRMLESKAQECKDLQRKNYDLQSSLERGSEIPQRYDKPVGADEVDSKELMDLLKIQIQEQQRMFKATEEERSQYLRLIHELKNESASRGSSDLDLELKSVDALRLQYEDSIRHYDSLRHQLENQIKSGSPPSDMLTSLESEVDNLRGKLKESESWNKSLQSRLDQLLPRIGAVGAAIDIADGPEGTGVDAGSSFQRLKQEKQQAINEMERQKSTRELLQKKLEDTTIEAEDTRKALDDLKRHYDRFAQLRSKEIETLTSNCEHAKAVIRNMEEKVASLHGQLQALRGGKGAEQDHLRDQVEGLGAVNDVLRKTLSERSEELKEAKEIMTQEKEAYRKLEGVKQTLAEDQKLLMEQIQDKNGQIAKLRKEVEGVKSGMKENENAIEKLGKECGVLQKDRQVLRDLNERLRNKLDEVSQTYDSLKSTNENDIRALREDLKAANQALDRQRHENEEATAVTMRLRDEIRSLQEASREVHRLAEELKMSQNVNKALQRQLSDGAKAAERDREALEPEMKLLRQKLQELAHLNRKLEDKLSFYERHANSLQEESHREKEAFNAEKEAHAKEIDTLSRDIVKLNEMNEELELKVKDLIDGSENSKTTIDRLQMDNRTKQEIIEKFENELTKQRTFSDVSTSITPNRRSSMFSQTTPKKPTIENQSQVTPEKTLREAVVKRDAYIEALRKQIEFYKMEKEKAADEAKEKLEKNSNNSNNLIALHIAEMRELRKELEQSICNNDALRLHLEHRLSEAEKEAEKIKDPQARASLLRENDRLRARIADNEVEIKEVKTRLLKEGERSSGLVLEKDSQIQQLKIKLEKRNLEFERVQNSFAPRETSSTIVSPIQSIASFTQTTPVKTIKLSKEVQVDTIALRAALEKKELEEKLRAYLSKLSVQDVAIGDLKEANARLRESLADESKLQSEIGHLKVLLDSKESSIKGLELKVLNLEHSLMAKTNESFLETEKRAANDELIALHISEMRKLKSELEASLENNNELKSQLEHRLHMIEQDAKKLKDPHLRLGLVRDNDLLRTQSIERQNAVLRQQKTIEDLTAEKKCDKENIKKLHQQIHNLTKVTANLKEEVTLYDRLQEHLSSSAARKQTKSHSPDSGIDVKSSTNKSRHKSRWISIP